MRVAGPLLALACAALGSAVAVPARAQVGFERIEFVNSTVKAQGQSSVPGMALRIHLGGGDLNDNWSVVPAVEYWRDSDRFDERYDVRKASERDLTFLADARYRFPIDKPWRPYVGAGLGFHLIRTSIETRDGVREFENSRDLAPNVLVGVDLPAASIVQTAIELNYHLVPDGFKQFKINWAIGVRL